MIEKPTSWPFTEALDKKAIVEKARLMSLGETKSAAIATALDQRTTKPFV